MEVTGFIDLNTFEQQLDGYQENSCVVARALVCTALKDLCAWIREQKDVKDLRMDVRPLDRDRNNQNGFRGIPDKLEPGQLVSLGEARDAAGYFLVIRGKGNRPLKHMYFVIPASLAAEIFPQQSFALPIVVGKKQKEEAVEVKFPSRAKLEGKFNVTPGPKPEDLKQDLPSLEPEKPAQEERNLIFNQEEVDALVQGVSAGPTDPITAETSFVPPVEVYTPPQNSGSGKHKNRK